jgi:hypothetical protein
MANDSGKKMLIPSKIMAGLALTVLLGLGLCGVAAAATSHSDKATEFFVIAGSICFFGGLILLILFGCGWAIFAIGKQLFGKKD